MGLFGRRSRKVLTLRNFTAANLPGDFVNLTRDSRDLSNPDWDGQEGAALYLPRAAAAGSSRP